MKIRILFLYIFEFLRDGFYVGIFLLLPFIAKDLSLDFFQIGSLQAVVNFMPIIMAVPITFLSIKTGGLHMLIFSLCLYSLVFSSMVAKSLEKIGSNQKAFSIRAMTNGISRVLFPLILGIVAAKGGIVVAFVVIAIATIIPIIPAYIFLKTKD